MTQKERILGAVEDLIEKFLWSDRKDDEDLPRGTIEGLVASGEITQQEIIDRFRISLSAGLKIAGKL